MGVREPAASDPTHGGGVLKVMGSEAGREAAGVGSADQSRAGELAAPRRLAGGLYSYPCVTHVRKLNMVKKI